MRQYVDPDQLSLEPIEGEDGWFFESTTFKRPDGSPHIFILMTDDRGVYVPEPPTGVTLPALNGVVTRVWLTERIEAPIRVPLGRFRDPKNRWSANISRRDGHHKITIEGESPDIVLMVLHRITRGSFEEWKDKVQADARAFLKRRRRRRPGMQGHPTDKGYERHGSEEVQQLLRLHNSAGNQTP